MRGCSKLTAATIGLLASASTPFHSMAQTITIVGSAHLHQLDGAPSADQLGHAVDVMATFEPTAVCVELMSGERVERLLASPENYGRLIQTVARGTVVVGSAQIRLLGIRPADARKSAEALVLRWDELETEDRARLIALQLAGFEFPSAALNWSYLDEYEREKASGILGRDAVEELDRALATGNEAYALGLPLARKAGLHLICTADSLEDESRGIAAAREHGSSALFAQPAFRARISELVTHMNTAWRPAAGPTALTDLLRFYNSPQFAELDRKLQWETMHESDNEAGALTRRLMFWHARTSEISAELFRALGQGPRERVMFIVGASHRVFTEASMRAQPWIEVVPAESWLSTALQRTGPP
jgi:hypothetical protein